MRERTFATLMKRLARAGFKREFVESAILPDWWEPSCADDPSILTDLEVRVARFLGVGVSELRTAKDLTAPAYAGARLRQVRDIPTDKLTPAIHAAVQVAGSVVRNLRNGGRPVEMPPRSGLDWRRSIGALTTPLRLDHLVDDLWMRGVPVVPLDVLPTPGFQALACIVENRPVIVLGYRHDEPSRVAFVVAHETGHVAAGDCSPGGPVVDQAEEEPIAPADLERRAERYALDVLTGGSVIPTIGADDPFELAKQAAAAERDRGIDAGTVIYEWARRTGLYAAARQTMQALYRARGARLLLRKRLGQWVDVESASDTDRSLLNCVFGGAAAHAGPR